MPVLSILISVLRWVDLLAKCLASLRRFMSAAIPHEVVVVLNQVEPASVGELQAAHPEVTFIPTPVTLGMAGSANMTRRHASGRFLVTLHDDAVSEPGWAEALLAAIACHVAPPQSGDTFDVEAAPRRAAEFAEDCGSGRGLAGPACAAGGRHSPTLSGDSSDRGRKTCDDALTSVRQRQTAVRSRTSARRLTRTSTGTRRPCRVSV